VTIVGCSFRDDHATGGAARNSPVGVACGAERIVLGDDRRLVDIDREAQDECGHEAGKVTVTRGSRFAPVLDGPIGLDRLQLRTC
jgi:hypothetical protein